MNQNIAITICLSSDEETLNPSVQSIRSTNKSSTSTSITQFISERVFLKCSSLLATDKIEKLSNSSSNQSENSSCQFSNSPFLCITADNKCPNIIDKALDIKISEQEYKILDSSQYTTRIDRDVEIATTEIKCATLDNGKLIESISCCPDKEQFDQINAEKETTNEINEIPLRIDSFKSVSQMIGTNNADQNQSSDKFDTSATSTSSKGISDFAQSPSDQNSFNGLSKSDSSIESEVSNILDMAINGLINLSNHSVSDDTQCQSTPGKSEHSDDQFYDGLQTTFSSVEVSQSPKSENMKINDTADTKPVESFENKVTDSDEDYIQELCVIQNVINKNKRETWYDNDTVVDTQGVLKRWNIKKMADPTVNNSRMNYRHRVFKETKKAIPRRFRPGLFAEDEDNYKERNIADFFMNMPGQFTWQKESASDGAGRFGPSNNCMSKSAAEVLINNAEDQSKKDEQDYQERIKAIDENTENLESEAYRELQQELLNLKRFNTCQIKQIMNNFQLNNAQKTFQRNCTYSNFNLMKKNMYMGYNERIKCIKAEGQDEKDALEALFKSGNYKKGKLKEYTAIELYQPKSKRLKYDDDGRRQILMLKKDAINIKIEDQIYAYFYGECR